MRTFSQASHFLNKMYKARISEIGRCYLLFKNNNNYMNYVTPLLEHHTKLGELDRLSLHRYFNWDDASITTSYYDYVLRRISKYGLQHGLLNYKKFPNYRENLKKLEDELTDYFLYEMKKEPLARQYTPMPI
jgi:hypothetical protein